MPLKINVQIIEDVIGELYGYYSIDVFYHQILTDEEVRIQKCRILTQCRENAQLPEEIQWIEERETLYRCKEPAIIPGQPCSQESSINETLESILMKARANILEGNTVKGCFWKSCAMKILSSMDQRREKVTNLFTKLRGKPSSRIGEIKK